MSQEQENNTMSADIEDDEPVQLRRDFSIPKNIKLTKIIIAIVINFLIGGAMFALSIVYYIIHPVESVYLMVFALFMTIIGGALLIQFPFAFSKALNSQLILGEKSVKFRNTFSWTRIPWIDVEEVLITEKLTKELDSNEIIAVDLIRFRTISKGHYFMGESYPIEEAIQIKESILETFQIALEGTDYMVKEKQERPSIRSRMIFYDKVIRDKIT